MKRIQNKNMFIVSHTTKIVVTMAILLVMTATSANALIAKHEGLATTATLGKLQDTTITVPAQDLPLLSQKLSTSTLNSIEKAEAKMRRNTLPKWLTPEQKSKLEAMTPEEASKAMVQWSEEYMEKRSQMDAKDKAVKKMLEKSRNKSTAQQNKKPIFTKEEQAKFTKMSDKEREDFLASKGMRVHIERERTSAALTEKRTSEALALMEGAPMMSLKEKVTSGVLDVNDPNVISVKDDKSSMVIKVRTTKRDKLQLPSKEKSK